MRAGQSCSQGTPMRIGIRDMGCVFTMDSRLAHTLEEAEMDATFILCIASARRLPIL